jgi:hypothetical protein
VPNAGKCASNREFDRGGTARSQRLCEYGGDGRKARSALHARCVCAAGARTAPGHGRVFFISGQAKIEGPGVPIHWSPGGIDFSVTLPAGIKATTFQLFERQYADLPMAPGVAAYLFSYAEFALPICLLLGFATRFAAVGLLAAASLRRARNVVVVACLLGVDSDGPGVVRSGHHLHRRIDPHHLPPGPAAGPRLSGLTAQRWLTASSCCAAPTSREKRHELCKRQRSRDRA